MIARRDRDMEFIEAIAKLQSYGMLAAERFANVAMDAESMAKLLRSEGIVYADTQIDGIYVSDEDRDAAATIKKLFGKRRRR